MKRYRRTQHRIGHKLRPRSFRFRQSPQYKLILKSKPSENLFYFLMRAHGITQFELERYHTKTALEGVTYGPHMTLTDIKREVIRLEGKKPSKRRANFIHVLYWVLGKGKLNYTDFH